MDIESELFRLGYWRYNNPRLGEAQVITGSDLWSLMVQRLVSANEVNVDGRIYHRTITPNQIEAYLKKKSNNKKLSNTERSRVSRTEKLK